LLPIVFGGLPMADSLLTLQVQPRSSRNAVVVERDGAVLIRLRAAPVDGEANAALQRFLADRLGVPRSSVRLVRGQAGRRKQVAVEGFSGEQLRRLLLADVPDSPP
jgi:uncharacterized protein (TIGR00251 family)